MTGVTQHALEEQPGLVESFGLCTTGACEGLDEPERAHIKGALFARKWVDARGRRVAIYQTSAHQSAMGRRLKNGVNGTEHARIGGRRKENQRHNQKRRVQVIASVRLRKRPTLGIPRLAPY